MYELDGIEVDLETLQNKAQEYGMEFDAYMQRMREKGLVEKTNGTTATDAGEVPQPVPTSTGSASGNGSSGLPILGSEEQRLSFGETMESDGTRVQRPNNPTRLVASTPNAGSGIGTAVFEELTPTNEDLPAGEVEIYRKLKERTDKQVFEFEENAYSNLFGRGVNKEWETMVDRAIGTYDIGAYAQKDPSGEDLKEVFDKYWESQSRVDNGEVLEIGGVSHPQTDNKVSLLHPQHGRDKVWSRMWGNITANADEEQSLATSQETIDYAKQNGLSIAEYVDELDKSSLSTYGGVSNGPQQELALLNFRLRAIKGGRVSPIAGEVKALNKRLAVLVDEIFYKDEVKTVNNLGYTHTRKTGERVPKDEDYKKFHDFATGHNIDADSPQVAEGGSNIIELEGFQLYLSQFANTSLGDLEKLNANNRLEEAGLAIEFAETVMVDITDKHLRDKFREYFVPYTTYDGESGEDMGSYNRSGTMNGFYKIPLGDLVASGAGKEGDSFNILSPNISEGQAYDEGIDDVTQIKAIHTIYGEGGGAIETEEEFWDYLNYRRKQAGDIQAKKAAIWKLLHMNQDPTTIGDSKLGRFLGSANEGLGALGLSQEAVDDVFGYTDARMQDIISQQVLDVDDLSVDQRRYLERDFGDKVIETAGGLIGMAPHLIAGNKLAGATGVFKLIRGMAGSKYIINGRKYNELAAIRWAHANHKGKSLLQLKNSGVITGRSANAWEKAGALFAGAIAEDVKMREGMMLTGGHEFDRGVGFGFALGGRVLPYGFKPGKIGYGADLSKGVGGWRSGFKHNNQLNTFLDATLKNGPAFVLAVEGGDAIGALTDELLLDKDGAWSRYIKEHWGDYEEVKERTILNLLTGTFLGATHLKENDFKSYQAIESFKFQATAKWAETHNTLAERAKTEGVIPGTPEYGTWLERQPEAKDLERFQEDVVMSSSYLARANDQAAWLDPVLGEKLHKEYFADIETMFKKQDKNLTIELTDQTLYNELQREDGTWDRQEVAAKYTRLDAAEGGRGTGVIQINLKKSKGRGTASHEKLHAYLDIMFDGKPELKEQFEANFATLLKKIKVEGAGGKTSNLYEEIINDPALRGSKRLKLEEMMAYTSEYLGLVENQHKIPSKALEDIARFWNNFSKSRTGQNGDFYTGQDVIRMLSTYSKTGKVSDLKPLKDLKLISIGEGSGESGALGSRSFIDANNVKKTAGEAVESFRDQKVRLAKHNAELFSAKPEGYKQTIAENAAEIKAINNHIKNGKKLVEQGEPHETINRHLSKPVLNKAGEQVRKGKNAVYESKFSKADVESGRMTQKEFDAWVEKGKADTIAAFTKLEYTRNQIMAEMEGKGVPKGGQAERDFIEEVTFELTKKFMREFDPSKHGDPHGWLFYSGGGQGVGALYWVKGNIMKAHKAKPAVEYKESIEKLYGDKTGEETVDFGEGEVALKRKSYVETIADSKSAVDYTDAQLDLMELEVREANVDVDKPYKHVKKLLNDQAKVTNSENKKVVPTKASDVKPTGALQEVFRMEADRHGIPLENVLANATLTPEYRAAAREVIYKNRFANIAAMPHGTSPSGKSMGMATSSFGEFLVKLDRVSMRETGSSQGVHKQELQKIYVKDYLDLFGIRPDGRPMSTGPKHPVTGKGVDGAIKQQIIQNAAINVNQIARTQQGKLAAKIGEGRGDKMAARHFDLTVEAIDKLVLDGHQRIAGAIKLTNANYNQDVRDIKTPGKDSFKLPDAVKEGYISIARKVLNRLFPGGKISEQSAYNMYHDLLGSGDRGARRMLLKYGSFGVATTPEQKLHVLNTVFKTRLKLSKNDGRTDTHLPNYGETLRAMDNLALEMRSKNASEPEIAKALTDKVIELFSKGGTVESFAAAQKANKQMALDKIDVIFDLANSGTKRVEGEDFNQRDIAMFMLKIQGGHAYGLSRMMGFSLQSINPRAFGVKTTNNKGEIVADRQIEHLNEAVNQTGKFMQLNAAAGKNRGLFRYAAEKVMGNSRIDIINKEQLSDLNKSRDKVRAETINFYSGKDLFVKESNRDTQYVIGGDNHGLSEAKAQLNEILASSSSIKRNVKAAKNVPANKRSAEAIIVLNAAENIKAIEAAEKADVKTAMGLKMGSRNLNSKEAREIIANHNRAVELGRAKNKKHKGMSTWDFDDTLARTKSNVLYKSPDGKKGKLNATEYAERGADLLKKGYEFDYSEFSKVVDGKPGPFLEKAIGRMNKFGTKDQFILTARVPEAAPAIKAFLDAQGLKIPVENIIGLGDSSPGAKAAWMLKKFSEGYNDMYFADDVLKNVDAVRDMLSTLDVKSKVQQALASRDFNAEINKILEHSLDIKDYKTFSKAEGRMRGIKSTKGVLGFGGSRRRLFVPDGAADLGLLLEPLYGKGKEGIKNKEWLDKNFYRKFERGINEYNTAKQKLTNEYIALRKSSKDVRKDLGKEVPGTSFSHDMAMRVYIWNKSGIKVPDLAPTTQQRLVEYIEGSPKHMAYAESVARITGIEGGLRKPTAEWWAETIASEINDPNRGVGRKEFLSDFTETRKEIFSEENLNKMESKLGEDWRDAIEDMFERMETGRSQSENLSDATNLLLNYFNGSVGTIMSFNTRSGMLQLISSVNFINSSFNNPVAAAKAFANLPQYSKDFMTIMNSDMLKQRRDGLEINVTESEIAAAAKNSKNPGQAIIAKILKAGYLPTKMADSFAIASGGATYYRNAINMYIKKGMSKVEAEKQAFLDFQAIAERTQQSSRPDLISRQQTTFAGKGILNFANTPMQMNRLAIKEMLDIGKGRYEGKAEFMDKLGKVVYYGFAQTLVFAGLSTAAFAILMGSDDDELKAKKTSQMLGTIMDSSLRGMGIKGAVLNGVVNAGKEFYTQKEKGYGADYSEVAEDLLSISPIVGSKFRKLDAAGNTYKYNREQIENEGLEFNLDNPTLKLAVQVTEALANVPVDRAHKKLTNLRAAADEDYAAWERFFMAFGWTPWDLNPELSKQKSKDAKPDAEKKKKKKRRYIEI